MYVTVRLAHALALDEGLCIQVASLLSSLEFIRCLQEVGFRGLQDFLGVSICFASFVQGGDSHFGLRIWAWGLGLS